MTDADAAIADLGLAVTDVWREECRKKDAEIERLRALIADVALAIGADEYATAGEQPPQLRTCATCHAVLAPGPQPATIYEQRAPQSEEEAYTELEKYGAGVPRNRRR